MQQKLFPENQWLEEDVIDRYRMTLRGHERITFFATFGQTAHHDKLNTHVLDSRECPTVFGKKSSSIFKDTAQKITQSE